MNERKNKGYQSFFLYSHEPNGVEMEVDGVADTICILATTLILVNHAASVR